MEIKRIQREGEKFMLTRGIARQGKDRGSHPKCDTGILFFV
jgi:hypothetical protein